MEWITKKNNGCRAEADVSVTRVKGKGDKPRYSIKFRNGSYLSITNNMRIVYALVDNKVFFNKSDERVGFKLTDFSVDNKACTLSASCLNDEFIGDYALQYDGKEKLYFIDTDKKFK